MVHRLRRPMSISSSRVTTSHRRQRLMRFARLRSSKAFTPVRDYLDGLRRTRRHLPVGVTYFALYDLSGSQSIYDRMMLKTLRQQSPVSSTQDEQHPYGVEGCVDRGRQPLEHSWRLLRRLPNNINDKDVLVHQHWGWRWASWTTSPAASKQAH